MSYAFNEEVLRHRIADAMLMEDNDRYEWKKWEVEQLLPNLIAITAERGMVNDEGTLASIIVRKHALIFVGKRGGVSIRGRKGRVSGWRNIRQELIR